MGKIVALQDADGNQEHFDVAQIKARQLNRWKGWRCSVGINTLHINPDGEVFAGTCLAGGKLGDIYTGWDTNTDWLICPDEQCFCGTEIKIPKAKIGHATDIADHQHIGTLNTEQVVAVDHIGPLPIHIQWNLGRFCNYDCTYCFKGPKGVHNDTEPHKPLEVLLTTVDKLHQWANGQTLQFCFAGGEPTLHPGFIAMCRHIKALGHTIHLTTNGSHGPRQWGKLIPYLDYVMISVHFEFTPIPVLVRNIKAMLEYQLHHNPALGIAMSVMAKPTDWERVDQLKGMLRELHPEFFSMVETRVSALQVMLGVDNRLMDYTPDQITRFGIIQE